jgi:hypothetical protein
VTERFGAAALKPTVEHTPEGTVVSGISTWPGWRFVVAADESSVKVVPPDGCSITPRVWKAMPIGQVLRLASSCWSPTALELVLARHDEGRELPRRPFGGSPKHSAVVAYTYRAALQRGDKPRDAIVAYFGVSEKTADRWLSEARAAGELGSYLEEKRQAAQPS